MRSRRMHDGAEGWVQGEAGWGVVKAEVTFPRRADYHAENHRDPWLVAPVAGSSSHNNDVPQRLSAPGYSWLRVFARRLTHIFVMEVIVRLPGPRRAAPRSPA